MLDLLAQTTYTYTTTSTSDEGVVAAVLATMAAMMVVLIPLLIFYVICLWKVFEKAGVEGWKALIPITMAGYWQKLPASQVGGESLASVRLFQFWEPSPV